MYNKLIEVESQALFPFTFFPKQFAAEGSQCFLSASTLSGMLCSPPWAGLQACLRSCLPFRFPAGLGCCVSGLLVFHPGCCVCLASCVPACLPPCLPASKAKTENEFQSAISATVWGLQFFFLDPSKFATKPVEGSTGSQCAGNLSRHWGFVQKIRKIVKKQTTEDTKDTELCFFFFLLTLAVLCFFVHFLLSSRSWFDAPRTSPSPTFCG